MTSKTAFEDFAASIRGPMPSFNISPPPPNPLVTSVQANQASEFCKRLVRWINDFEAQLDAKSEVGIRLVSFGETVVLRLDDIAYSNPSLIMFKGRTERGDDPAELVQHVSQISILLVKLRLKGPKRRIGFRPSEAK
jgi:hypothetical protein